MIGRAFAIYSIFLIFICGIVIGGSLSCSKAELVIYSLTFETYWTRQKFPKQYPEFRPSAHWSKLIGMTHDDEYMLFRIGQKASEALKIFAETGKTDFFNTVNHTFDEFYSESIKTGAGKSEVNFFADGNHTMVSFAAKIIPSPDWFVGVDSLVLCDQGKWIDALTIEGNPIDAGTDSGYTFTAPNWETEPPEEISQITSQFPKHPANSFYYPLLQNLPVIATFHIRQKKLYHLVKSLESNEQQKSIFPLRIPAKNFIPAVISNRPEHLDNEITAHKELYKYKKAHKKRRMRKLRLNQNWSQWSRCNTTCGKGYATRTRQRTLTAREKNDLHTEKKRCSDYTGCYNSHFIW